MNRKELEEKQMLALETFYKETDISEKKRNSGFVSIVIIMMMLALVVVLLGSQEKQVRGSWWIMPMFACFANMGYLGRFSEFRGDESKYSVVLLKLKYLPVPGRVMYRYIFRKFLEFQSVLYMVLQMGQLLVSVLDSGRISVLCIVFTFTMVWLLPVVLGVLYLRICWNVKGEVSL